MLVAFLFVTPVKQKREGFCFGKKKRAEKWRTRNCPLSNEALLTIKVNMRQLAHNSLVLNLRRPYRTHTHIDSILKEKRESLQLC